MKKAALKFLMMIFKQPQWIDILKLNDKQFTISFIPFHVLNSSFDAKENL